jgi:asparagine synthase (glutamine-hydrolysing)
MLERHLDLVTARRRRLRGRLYGPALRGRASENGFASDLAGRLNGASSGPSIRQRMVLDQMQWLPDDVLVKADRTGMRVSLVVRTPYLNRELAEFAGTVPEGIHVCDGGNTLLRALLAQVAPEAARGRPAPASPVPTSHCCAARLRPS